MTGGDAAGTSRTSRLQTLLPFGLGLILLLAFIEALGVIALKHPERSPDFRDFYTGGYLLRTEPAHLYDKAEQERIQNLLIAREDLSLYYAHTSVEAVLFAAFSLLPFSTAYLTAIAFNALLLGLVVWVSGPLFSGRIRWLQAWPGLLLLTFAPVFVTLWNAQDSILFLLLVCLVWRAFAAGRDDLAGWILALALIRFQIAIPLAILLAVWKGRRFATTFVLGAALFALACVALTGVQVQRDYIHLLSVMSLANDSSPAMQQQMGVIPAAMPNLFGLLYSSGVQHLAPRIGTLLLGALSALVLLGTGWRLRNATNAASAFSAAVLASILVSRYLYVHDATLLALPIALMARRGNNVLAAICYYALTAVFFLAGARWLFLVAVPLLAFLWQTLRATTQDDSQPQIDTASPMGSML